MRSKYTLLLLWTFALSFVGVTPIKADLVSGKTYAIKDYTHSNQWYWNLETRATANGSTNGNVSNRAEPTLVVLTQSGSGWTIKSSESTYYASVENWNVTVNTTSYVWTITADGDYYTIARADGKYAGAQSTSANQAVYSDNASATQYIFEPYAYITFNYICNGQKVGTNTIVLKGGDAYPESMNIPTGYTYSSGWPTGNSPASGDDATFSIEVTDNNSGGETGGGEDGEDVTITYVYTYVPENGGDKQTWLTEEYTVKTGSNYPAFHERPSSITYGRYLPLEKVSKSETIEIPCHFVGGDIILPSESFDNAQWVYLSLSADDLYLKGQLSGASLIKTSTFTTTVLTGGSLEVYQWAFIGNPFTGYKIKNKYVGDSMLLTAASPVSGASASYIQPHFEYDRETLNERFNKTWQFTPHNLGYYISREGEDYYICPGTDGSPRFMNITTDSPSNTNLFCVIPTDTYVAAETVKDIDGNTVVSGSTYRIVNRKTGEVMADNGSSYLESVARGSANSQIWTFTESGTGCYTIKNVSTSRYIATTSEISATGGRAEFLSSESGVLCFSDVTSAVGHYYRIATTTNLHNSSCRRIWLGDDDTYVTPWGGLGLGTEWYLEPTTAKVITYTDNITSGKYYRLHNRSYTRLALTDKGTTLSGGDDNADNYSQIWQINQVGSYYQLKNFATGNYVQSAPATSQQWQTGNSAYSMSLQRTTANSTNYITFKDPSNTFGLHCSATQGYNVVGWSYTSDASWWRLEEVEVTQEMIDAVNQAQNEVDKATSYTSALDVFFTDRSCTRLMATYITKTDAELRAAMAAKGLPEAVQDMGVRVKNDTWNEDATYSSYEKRFRIGNYSIYTDCDEWQKITQVGPFGCLHNPTGITATNGDIIYLYVKDYDTNGTTLTADIVSGTNRFADHSINLQAGCNAIAITSDCEIFITYTLHNATSGTWDGKTVNNYSPVTVHIEGGTATGTWDASRGFTNADWTWLQNNMFTNKYLHVKGNSTLLNCVTAFVKDATQVEDIMKAWDFIFDTQESLVGCDQWRSTGAYKPIINNRYIDSGNPNWDGGHGCNFTGLTSTGIFNKNNLYNTSTDGGYIWVISHEEGHAHQYPIKMAGTTEETNNSLAQCVNLLWNSQPGLGTRRSSRGEGLRELFNRFNSNKYSWIDLASNRNDDSYSSLWMANRWFFQLWLYFDYLGNYKPASGKNTGFSYVSALCDKLRQDPIKYSTSKSSPVSATDDYLKVAKYAAEVAQADLSGFFEVYGFWKTTPTVSNDNDTNPVYYFGDYAGYYVQVNASDVASTKATMKAYSKKLSNIIFIDDRGSASDTWPTYNNNASTTFGETGWMNTFMHGVTRGYTRSFDSGYTHVYIKNGCGAVGFKVLDQNGDIVWLSNFNMNTIPTAIANGIGLSSTSTYRLYACAGDGTDYMVGTHNSDFVVIRNGEFDPVTISELTTYIRNLLNGTDGYTEDGARKQIQLIMDSGTK